METKIEPSEFDEYDQGTLNLFAKAAVLVTVVHAAVAVAWALHTYPEWVVIVHGSDPSL